MPPILVDLESQNGTKVGPGPLAALTWKHVARLDRGGSIAFDVPAISDRTSILALRRYARCYGQVGGTRTELGLGIIDSLDIDTDARQITVSGDDLLRELAMRTVSFLELKNAGATPMSLSDALDAILTACNVSADPDWTLDRTTYASTGTTTNTSTTISSVTNISNWTGREGAPIFGTNIPAGATVVSVGASSLVISAAATATAAGVALARTQVFYVFAGESVLASFNKVAEMTGTHWRLGTGRQIVWLYNVQPSSGIRAVIGADPQAAESNPDICLITGLDYIQDSSEVISHLFPKGSGSGADAMRLANDAHPGTPDPNITTRTAPAGYTLDLDANVLRRDAAETDYGFYSRHQSFSDIGPTVNTTDANYATALVNARNTLFDAALEHLRAHSYPQDTYRLDIAKLDRLILPGETIRVIYRGWVDGYKWVDIDTDLLVLESTTEITDAGIHTPGLVVATIDRWPANDVELLVKLLRDTQQRASHDQPVTYAQTSGTSGTVTSGAVVLDEDVTTATVNHPTVAETSLYSFSVPGGTLGTKNTLRLVMIGSWLNNTGGSLSPLIKVKYGATTIFNNNPVAQATAVNARAWRVECEIVAANSATAQIASGTVIIGSAAGVGGVTNGNSIVQQGLHTTVAENSATAKTLEITVTLPAVTATQQFVCYAVHLELLRR